MGCGGHGEVGKGAGRWSALEEGALEDRIFDLGSSQAVEQLRRLL